MWHAPPVAHREGSPAPVVVRPASTGDLLSVAGVRARSWQSAYRHLMPAAVLDPLSDDAELHDWVDRVAGAGPGRIWVAEVAGTTVGFAAAGPDRRPDAPAGSGEVYALYADPSVWGRGVGRALMAAVLDDLAAGGSTVVSLWVLEGNQRGIAFYERAGFTATGDRAPCRAADLTEIRYSRPLRAHLPRSAAPGLSPARPPAAGHEAFELDVDGERFAVTVGAGGDNGYTWLTGPNPGYGFGESGPPDRPLEDHVRAIRDFLAQVDPDTGYLSDD